MLAFHERVDFRPDTRFKTACRRADHFEFSWHYHPEYEITLVLNGSGWRYIGNSVEPYTGPELVLIPPDLPHSWVSDVTPYNQKAWVLQFNRHCLGEGFWQSPDFQEAMVIFNHRDAMVFGEEVSSLVQPVLESFLKATGLARIACFIEICSILSKSSPRRLSFDQYQPSLDRESQEKVNRIIAWIRERIQDHISVDEAASVLHMSESTFRRFFKRNTGKTLVEFVNESRINHACRRLVMDGVPVSEAALDAGFHNLAHFNRLFLRQMGITPREFRQQQKTP